MSEPHAVLGAMPRERAQAVLLRCCGASRWVQGMLARLPFASTPRLMESAREIWGALSREDFLEAFSHHPAIGEDVAALAQRFPGTADLAGNEQSSVAGASRAVLEALRDANVAYRQRFGYTFVVCATGKTAEQMLAILRARLDNDPAAELAVAAGEQMKITELRLQKLTPMTTLSSHVLDTTLGRPAQGIAVKLEALDDAGSERTIAERTTNHDGRVTDLGGAGLGPGAYRLTFETGAYHRATGQEVFYPRVEVLFHVGTVLGTAVGHLHIPLLLSPFGYSTYRGS